MPYTQLLMSFEPICSPKKRPFRKTSTDAKESIKDSKEATYEKILKAYKDCEGGLTSEECAAKANISYASAHKRIPELIQQHKLYNTGETRKNKSRRSAMVRKLVK